MKYHSIETVFTRDKTTNKLNFGELRFPEFSCINQWVVQEKIDGVNIRLVITDDGVQLKGRTDNAQIPHGLQFLPSLITEEKIKLIKEFLNINSFVKPVTIYGEGYGAGIQKGHKYREDNGLAIFDVLIGEKGWLTVPDVMKFYLHVFNDIESTKLPPRKKPIHLVPVVKMIETASIPINKNELTAILPQSLVTPSVQPEGIVARPLEILLDKWGNRIMWKLCYREFT